jgi:twitching motility protein PilT
MSLVPSLLQAIVHVDGEALVMHAGDKPYVVSPTGQVDLASRGLALDAVNGIVNQLLPADLQHALDEFGAVQYELPAVSEFPGEHFTIVAARGGGDVWVEIRRRRIPDEDRVPDDLFPPRDVAAAAQPYPVYASAGSPSLSAPTEAVADGLDIDNDTPAVAEMLAQPKTVRPATSDEEPTAPRVAAAVRVEAARAIEPPASAAAWQPAAAAEAPAAARFGSTAAPELELPMREAPVAPPMAVAAAPEATPIAAAKSGIDLGTRPMPPAPVAAVPVAPVEPARTTIAEPTATRVTEPPRAIAVPTPVASATPVADESRRPASLTPVVAATPVPEPPTPVVIAARADAEPPRATPVVEASRRPAAPTPVVTATPVAEPPPPVVVAARAPVEPPPSIPVPVAVAPPVAEAPRPSPAPTPMVGPQPVPVAVAPPQPAVVLPISRNPIRAEQPLPPLDDPTMSGLDRLLRVSAARGASTLYLSSDSRPAVRVDGELQNLEGEPLLAARDVESLLLTLMPERNHEALRTGAATEWICDIEDVGRVRCMSFRDHRGPGGVFRLMPMRSISAEQLGLPKVVQGLAIEPEGLVLVAGPRSSGKRTLMSAFVDLINRTHRDHVITIEREINIVHERGSSFISQREVRGNDDDLLAAARAALREDPDVLMIEDLRTADLMNVALEAAASGHLVVGGFSAHSATAAVDRIIDLYAPEHRRQVQFALADSLRGVIVQVLLRKKGGGRVAAREVLLNTPAVSSVIAEGKTSQLPMAIEGGRRYGMMPLNDALVGLVQQGTVDARDAYRYASDRSGLLAALKRHGLDTSFAERLA